jgi:hypothetical protein
VLGERLERDRRAERALVAALTVEESEQAVALDVDEAGSKGLTSLTMFPVTAS